MFPTTTTTRIANGAAPGQRVGSAIASASARTGVDFDYLMGQARIESGFNPIARARTSSATGLYQFVDQTWLATVKEHGAKHGLDWAAREIRQNGGGRYSVADAGTRRAILDLRNDPEAASAMAAEYAADNRAYLEGNLGRGVENVDLYLAHFLGPAGAKQFLGAYDSDPASSAAAILPAAASANRPIFYRPDGSARSVAEIRDNFAAKLGGASAMPAMRYAAVQPQGSTSLALTPARFAAARPGVDQGIRPIAPPSAEYARLAYEILSNVGGRS